MPEYIGTGVAPGDTLSETLLRSPGCSETVEASGCCFPSPAQLRFYIPCGLGLIHSRGDAEEMCLSPHALAALPEESTPSRCQGWSPMLAAS